MNFSKGLTVGGGLEMTHSEINLDTEECRNVKDGEDDRERNREE